MKALLNFILELIKWFFGYAAKKNEEPRETTFAGYDDELQDDIDTTIINQAGVKRCSKCGGVMIHLSGKCNTCGQR